MATALASATELPDKLITRAMLREFTPVSDNTLFVLIREGRFPRPLPRPGRRNGKAVGPRLWLLSEINAWLASQKKDRDAAPARAA